MLKLALLLLGLCACGRLLAAGELDPAFRVVPLHNGLNAVDIDGDGKDDVIVVGHRENHNAHSLEVTTLFIWAENANNDSKNQLQIVPLLPAEGDKEANASGNLRLETAGGADGLLHDFRLLLDKAHHAAVIVTADREFGSNYADTQPVTFKFYRLERYTEGIPGQPLLAFKAYKKVVSKKPYLDVEDAFKGELTLPLDGRHPFSEDL